MSLVLSGATPVFKFARPVLIQNGLLDDADVYARKEIALLSSAFNRRCVDPEFMLREKENVPGKIEPLKQPLQEWIDKVPALDVKNMFNYEELIDKQGDTALLYEITDLIGKNKLSYNVGRLLKETPVKAFLFCKAKYFYNLNSSAAIFKYMTNEVNGGIKILYDYIVLEAAIKIVKDSKIEVGNDENFLGLVGPKLKEQNISFADGVFSQEVKNTIQKLVYNNSEYQLVNSVKDKLNIDDADVPALVSYIKKSAIPIDKDNALYYLSIALSNIKNNNINFPALSSDSSTAEEADFSVRYYDDDKSILQVVRENVVCAAQMYYVMTLGEELEIFNVINQITTKYLPSGKVDIRNREVLQDLQLYVFSDSFRDLKNGTIYKKTLAPERYMFYRQVFNMGDGEMVEGMVTNGDFRTQWENLLTETVKYISKVEQSENPQLYVSRQNIFQAIEDLQYNLSTNCTGMAKVMTPIINKELDFVIERFLKNEEITRQLAFNNSGSFWKVIERVLRDMRQETPNVAALRNKAVYGHKILNTIANYTPLYMNDDANFSEFVATVEAFIIANSQLEGSQQGGMGQEMPAFPEPGGMPPPYPGGNGNGNTNGHDDWDF